MGVLPANTIDTWYKLIGRFYPLGTIQQIGHRVRRHIPLTTASQNKTAVRVLVHISIKHTRYYDRGNTHKYSILSYVAQAVEVQQHRHLAVRY